MRFSSHNVAHILIRTCIVLWSSAMLLLDFVPWPSRSLPHLAYPPGFFFSANSLSSFRSYCLESPVWVLLHPCTYNRILNLKALNCDCEIITKVRCELHLPLPSDKPDTENHKIATVQKMPGLA